MNLFWARALTTVLAVVAWSIVFFALGRFHLSTAALASASFWVYLGFLMTFLVCAITLTIVAKAYIFGRVDAVTGTVERASLLIDGTVILSDIRIFFPICPDKDVSIDGSRVVIFFAANRPRFCLLRNFEPVIN